MNRRALWLACTALTVVAAPTAHAQTVWDGSTSTDWFTASNWSANAVPTAADAAIIATISPNPTVISSGAAVSNTGVIGPTAGRGQVTVTGAGSTWTVTNFLRVGDLSADPGVHAILNVLNGGRVTSGTGSIGRFGAIGEATVRGVGSRWTNVGDLFVGRGTLSIQDGGAVAGANVRIGDAGQLALVTVSGAGSTLSSNGTFEMGLGGNGTLMILGGGRVSTTTQADIATTAGSNGTVTADGGGSNFSQFLNAGPLRVGVAGNGTLNILNGAHVTNGTAAIIASGAGSIGVVTLDGPFSTWVNNSPLIVGAGGSGALNVQNGGRVFSHAGTIAGAVGSTGQVTVTGMNSTWNVAERISVGARSTGSLNILSGGVVQNSLDATIGGSNGSGTVLVSGTGSMWTTQSLLLGGGAFGAPSTGTLTLQNDGVVNTAAVGIATQANAVGTLNIGAAAGAAPAAPGTLNAPSVGFGAGTGKIVFNHAATNYTFAPLIGGPGVVLVEAGTTSLTANSTYSGNTTVNGGRLLVNGSIANSNTTASAGGTLGGSGIVGNTTINGGTLAPGNSVGTLTVQGNLVLTAAATYMVEVDASGADRTNVAGTATLGGAQLSVVSSGGRNQRYTILNATGGVSGTFGAVTANNVIATLSYDTNNVFLDVQAALGLGMPLNQNQQTVATAINTVLANGGTLPTGFGSLFDLAGAGLASALSQLSGEAATGTQQTTFNAMDSFLNVMTDPYLGERGTGGEQAGSSSYADEAMAYASKPKGRNPTEQDAYAAMARKAPPRAAAFERRWSVWGAGYGGTQSTDGNGSVGSNDYTARIYGGAAGFDYRLTPDTLVGFALGGAGTTYGLANGLGGGRSEMFQAGVYGRHTFGPAYISAALAHGWQDVTTDRNVLLSQLRANFDANAISGRLEAGYRFATGMGGITPYAAGQFTSFFLPAYTEQVVAGVNTFALSYAEKDVTASRTELGLRGDTSFAMQDAIVTLRGRAAWAHNFDTERSINAIFQTLPAAGFVVNGAAQARDSALVSAGAEANWLNGFTVAATFEGEFSNRTESYAGKGIVRYQR